MESIEFEPTIYTERERIAKRNYNFVNSFIIHVGDRLNLKLVQVGENYFCESKEWDIGISFEFEDYYFTCFVWQNTSQQLIDSFKINQNDLPFIWKTITSSIIKFVPSLNNPWTNVYCEKGVYVDPNEGEVEITNCELKEKLSE